MTSFDHQIAAPEDHGGPAGQTPRPPKLADQVAAHIEQLIANSVLKVGQPLPSERRLMDKLQCSRAALREGLRILRGKGLIHTEHGRGSFVAATTDARQAAPMLQLFASQPRTLFDLLEVRAVLEAEAARLAAMRATVADMVLIRRHFEAWQDAQQSAPDTDGQAATATMALPADEHARRDHAFHRAIGEATHNPVLVHTLQTLSELTLGSVVVSARHLYARPHYKQQIDRQHLRIYRAIAQRKPEAAWRAAREHVLSVRENLQELERDNERLVRATMRLHGWQ